MSVFSKFLQLQNGAARTVDLSTNTLSLGNLQLNGATSGNLTLDASGTTTSYSLIFPAVQGGSGDILQNDGSGNLSWVAASAGSVTSVALADGSTSPIYSISGSPVTSSGTLTFTLSNQNANLVFAGPSSGSAAQPSFRSLVAADIPTVAASNAISNSFIAGQSFSANTSYVVRWGMNALTETTDRIYAADYDTTSFDEFWAAGIALSTSAISAGQSIPVYSFGMFTLGSADTPFLSTDIGKPVWLTASGAFSTTAPSGDTQADLKIGVVVSTTQIWIDDQVMGIGGGGTQPIPSAYEETVQIVASGGDGSTTLNGPISPGTAVTLPSSETYYGKELKIFLNGLWQTYGTAWDWQTSGSSPYAAVTFTDTLEVGDLITFYKDA